MTEPPFADRVLAWFDRHGRHDLPWQHPRTPYRVWLAEIMLQQTQVGVVTPYYLRFLAALPTLRDLAAADPDRLAALWAGLGYYARARNLQRAAQLCVAHHDGQLPTAFDALHALPGIGRSTAAAILAQAHGQHHAILDGNVKRILCRYHGVAGWPGSGAVERQLWTLAESHLPPVDATSRMADYTQAQMDLGATVCTRSKPACPRCPLRADCMALHSGAVARLPQRKPAKALPHRHTLMLLLRDAHDRILLTRRPPTGIWAGLWSLPEASDADAARDLLARHSDRQFDAAQALPPIEHDFSHYRLTITPLLWRDAAPAPRIADNPDLRWQPLASLHTLGLPAPVKRLLDALPDADHNPVGHR